MSSIHDGRKSEVAQLAQYVHSLVKEIADLERRVTKLEKRKPTKPIEYRD